MHQLVLAQAHHFAVLQGKVGPEVFGAENPLPSGLFAGWRGGGFVKGGVGVKQLFPDGAVRRLQGADFDVHGSLQFGATFAPQAASVKRLRMGPAFGHGHRCIKGARR